MILTCVETRVWDALALKLAGLGITEIRFLLILEILLTNGYISYYNSFEKAGFLANEQSRCPKYWLWTR